MSAKPEQAKRKIGRPRKTAAPTPDPQPDKVSEATSVAKGSTGALATPSVEKPVEDAAANVPGDEEEAEKWQEYDPEYESYMRDKNAENMIAVKQMLDVMSPEQLRRYETYRSAAFPKAVMRKCIGQSIPEKVAVIVGGVTKLFVGELTEEAISVMAEWNECGPIRPAHLREANRRLRERGHIPSSKYRIQLFD